MLFFLRPINKTSRRNFCLDTIFFTKYSNFFNNYYCNPMEVQQINTESYWSVGDCLGVLVLHDSLSALFLIVWLLWSLPTAPCLGLCCFGWVWLLCWTGELLCLLLFWGQVQLSTCLLPIKVNGTLETLFCWLRSWGAASTVKCKHVTSFRSFCTFHRECLSQKLVALCQTLWRFCWRQLLTWIQKTSLPFWTSSMAVENLLVLLLLPCIRGCLTWGSQES